MFLPCRPCCGLPYAEGCISNCKSNPSQTPASLELDITASDYSLSVDVTKRQFPFPDQTIAQTFFIPGSLIDGTLSLSESSPGVWQYVSSSCMGGTTEVRFYDSSCTIVISVDILFYRGSTPGSILSCADSQSSTNILLSGENSGLNNFETKLIPLTGSPQCGDQTGLTTDLAARLYKNGSSATPLTIHDGASDTNLPSDYRFIDNENSVQYSIFGSFLSGQPIYIPKPATIAESGSSSCEVTGIRYVY